MSHGSLDSAVIVFIPSCEQVQQRLLPIPNGLDGIEGRFVEPIAGPVDGPDLRSVADRDMFGPKTDEMPIPAVEFDFCYFGSDNSFRRN
jgi:hypothetical protein